MKAEESLLRQKSRVKWLKEGDQNTTFFHKVVQIRRNRNQINVMIDEEGNDIEDPTMIKNHIENYFKFLIGSSMDREVDFMTNMPSISTEHTSFLQADVTEAKIIQAFQGINPDKAPGPDGYNAYFFRHTWEVVGKDVIEAVKHFFKGGHMLKEINGTFLTLIPKIRGANKVKDFCPIALCNTVYKIISKIIANRLNVALGDIISKNQSAFIKGWCIQENILVAHEVARGWKRKCKEAAAIIKVNL